MWETLGIIGESKAAMNPMIVIGATTGPAKTFAGIETREKRPEIARIIGVHINVAASGIAITWASFSWPNLSVSQSSSFGANNRIPAVAATESANPGSIA